MNYEAAAQSLRPDIAEVDVRQVICRYGIDGISSLSRVNAGTEGTIFIVNFGDHQMVAKVYIDDTGLDSRIEEEAGLYAFINEAGGTLDFSAPRVIPTQNGGMSAELDISLTRSRVVLMDHVVGQPLPASEFSTEEMYPDGRALANIHGSLVKYERRASAFPRPVVTDDSPIYRNLGLKRLARKVIGKPTLYDVEMGQYGFLPTLKKTPNVTALHDAVLAEMERIDPLISDFLRDIPPPHQNDLIPIHNDLKPDHVIVNEESICFIDWGGRRLGTTPQELGVFLLQLYSGSVISYEKWKELCDGLIEGYSSVRKLEDYEIASVRAYIIARAVESIKWFCWLSTQTGSAVDIDNLTRRFELVKKIIELE